MPARCPIIVFTKVFPEHDVDGLIRAAEESGFEGFDLCVRPGFVINPDNVTQALPDACHRIRRAGLEVPMVSGEGSLLSPDDPSILPMLRAMDRADVRLLKLGYFAFDATRPYRAQVDDARRALAGLVKLAREHNVRLCYHTHMGMLAPNCAAVMYLLRDLDPRWIGSYIDPCHMRVEGERFAFGAAMVADSLCAVGLKEVALVREDGEGHGRVTWNMGLLAGEGMIDWTEVFTALAAVNFTGPLSAHCTVLHYGKVPPADHPRYIRSECVFYRAMRETHLTTPATTKETQ